ncbi:Alanine--tRNA ligase [Buchnera aphidicola (Tuberolachnus salignus)]|uniref:Alanine--tRNA ligase n=1 Tax=Buchnera aphidicola subsp. Tuberolachnus salignus TaxID=98804 RepID=A0A160SXK9_BUCTT|nr:alanine--tRNA ligase [Buchnera aphidicola]CUR53245.1 Alanine--tRNA ligase [Buchnera aphidicola (Tuberolachnus salignus)]
MNITTSQIRKKFLQFFKIKKHKILSGSSIIPNNDNTLLFTNAGMNQFKNFYLGIEISNYQKIATSQYCIRTGGKHNDLKNIGYTNFHHTLFEMLGNFSFGNYFKKKAIIYAWTLLTDKKWFNLSKKKIWITYYKDDYETRDIWLNIIKINKKKLIPIGDKNQIKYNSDNFWKMGKSGPCGPCTEIFYDQGKKVKGNLPGSLKNLGSRYLEIWNLVFLQFNCSSDGKLSKLPQPSIDTGMGLERITAILQNVTSSYKTTDFLKLFLSISKKLNISITQKISLRIITDHIRTTTFLLNEKLLPNNEGRGYILRHIIRRALSHGYTLGLRTPFFYKLIKYAIKNLNLKNSYINIKENFLFIQKILKKEEKQFFSILHRSMLVLLKNIKTSQTSQLSGKTIFYLYDTLGLPVEISEDICKKNNITINFKEFLQEKKYQKKIQQQKQKKKNIFNNFNSEICASLLQIKHPTIFSGYTKTQTYSKILQIISKDSNLNSIEKNNNAILILDITPFYSESGGQIGDSGTIICNKSIFLVKNTKKYLNFIGHIGVVSSGNFKVYDEVLAKIDTKKRFCIQSNHTSTHLLQAALRKICNKNITQKGSFIDDKHLRFDFEHNKLITENEINCLELLINKKIQKNIPIKTSITNLEDAKKKNTLLLFLDKYKKKVRLVEINNFSLELCGGTHHKYTGNIGFFKIISNKKIGANIQRLEARTGSSAILYIQEKHQKEILISNILCTESNYIIEKIQNLIQKNKFLIHTNNILNIQNIENLSKKILKSYKIIHHITIIIYFLKNKIYNNLRCLIQKIQRNKKINIIILFQPQKKYINFIIYVKKNIIKNLNALIIMKKLLFFQKGKGGGKENLVEGILITQKNILNIIVLLKNWIYKKLLKHNH